MIHPIGASGTGRSWHGSTEEETMNPTIIFAMLAVLIGGVVVQALHQGLIDMATMFPS